MEQDILVTGLKDSNNMHGLEYRTLVTDRDLNVYQNILDTNTYPYVRMKKLECSNHLLLNSCGKVVNALKLKI